MENTGAQRKHFIVIGECLIEMRHQGGSNFSLTYSGDTFNVAKYLAHYANELAITVEFLTAMGTDPYSQLFLKLWQEQGIDTSHIPCLKEKLPGLYLRLKTKNGCSHPIYYRSVSAARELFACPDILSNLEQLAETNFTYLSSTSMAILDKLGGESLLEFLHKTHQFKSINFYASQDVRGLLGQNLYGGLDLIQRMLVHIDIALCEFKQEQVMFNDQSPNKTLKRITSWGVDEIILIVDDETCLLHDAKGTREIKLDGIRERCSDHGIIEAFNAGYIIARCQGKPPELAIQFAQELANIAKKIDTNLIPDKNLPKLDVSSTLENNS